jgi:hypothetical protein
LVRVPARLAGAKAAGSIGAQRLKLLRVKFIGHGLFQGASPNKAIRNSDPTS